MVRATVLCVISSRKYYEIDTAIGKHMCLWKVYVLSAEFFFSDFRRLVHSMHTGRVFVQPSLLSGLRSMIRGRHRTVNIDAQLRWKTKSCGTRPRRKETRKLEWVCNVCPMRCYHTGCGGWNLLVQQVFVNSSASKCFGNHLNFIVVYLDTDIQYLGVIKLLLIHVPIFT